jgi:hypothetical protein
MAGIEDSLDHRQRFLREAPDLQKEAQAEEIIAAAWQGIREKSIRKLKRSIDFTSISIPQYLNDSLYGVVSNSVSESSQTIVQPSQV